MYTIFGRLLMKGIPASKVYFYYSEMIKNLVQKDKRFLLAKISPENKWLNENKIDNKNSKKLSV